MSSPPSHADPTRVGDVVDVLDRMTGGRLTAPPGPDNPWYVTKSSGIPGKSVTETPGLVLGDADAVVHRLAVAMTLTEQDIELAQAIGVDLVLAHHPVADAASSGGVALADYLPRYGISVIECHEAFHGLHPGIGFLHGHTPYRHEGALGGVHGKVVMVGRPLPGIRTLGDIIGRIRTLLARDVDEAVLHEECQARGDASLRDSVTAPGLRILHGYDESPVGPEVMHAFPHTGFDADDLELLLGAHPEISTLILSISSAGVHDELVRAARRRGLNVIVGSSHATEILENGIPLAYALDTLLPGVEVLLFRSRVIAVPLSAAATGGLAAYGTQMSQHLLANMLERQAL